MDIIEHETAFYDVIVLQTVLEEVRNRSLPLYNRLRALTKSDEKRFYVFHNEFRQETYVKRLQGEIINDRNDRAVRRACSWYKSHLAAAVGGTATKLPEIVMISDDRDNLVKAKKEGIVCCTSTLRYRFPILVITLRDQVFRFIHYWLPFLTNHLTAKDTISQMLSIALYLNIESLFVFICSSGICPRAEECRRITGYDQCCGR